MIATRSLITVRYGNINCGVSSSGKEELSGGTVDWTLPLSICTWILQFSSLKYPVWWTWLSYRRQKNPVQTRKKIQFNKLDISNWSNITYLWEAAMHSLVKHVSPSPLLLWKFSFPLTSCKNNMKIIVFRSIWNIKILNIRLKSSISQFID